MKHLIISSRNTICVNVRRVLCLGFGALAFLAMSQSQAQSVEDFQAIPLFSAQKGDAAIMLTMANDHQLFFKAYNDYADIFAGTGSSTRAKDFDGIPDITFNRFFPYEGYFDANRCYTYDNAEGVFEPVANTRNDKARVSNADVGYCNELNAANDPLTSQWSGRFLNWLSMTRMDIVRYALYGGLRVQPEAASETILERAYLPNDVHSFAKYYAGDDIKRLADVSALSNQPNTCPSGGNCDQGYTFCNTTKFESVSSILGAGNVNAWEDGNIEINRLSQQVKSPPLLRAVKGDFRFWASSERYQCLYGAPGSNSGGNGIDKNLRPDGLDGEVQYFDTSFTPGGNGNDVGITGVSAYDDSPYDRSRGKDFIVRVKVCDEIDDGYVHQCKSYDNGGSLTLKPIGALHNATQENGGNYAFGLITGGYLNNIEGGVLRKNLAAIDGEINADGTFNTAGDSIIGSLNAFRIVDYRFYSQNEDGSVNNLKGSYTTRCNGASGAPLAGEECVNWGNPFAEMLVHSYNYLAGLNTLPAIPIDLNNPPSRPEGLNPPATFSNVIGLNDASRNRFACSNLEVFAFNGSVSSFDSEAGDINLRAVVDGTAPTKTIADAPVKQFVGEADTLAFPSPLTAFLSASNSDSCSVGTVSSFLSVEGVCPEAPSQKGSYLAVAAAVKVAVDGVRTDIQEGEVRTTGISLTGATPVMGIANASGDAVTLIPTCFASSSTDGRSARTDADRHSCSLVDFQVLTYEPNSRTYLITYEDREYANDFDSDLNMVVKLERTVGNQITITRTIFDSSTNHDFLLGFVASGIASNGSIEDLYYDRNGNACEIGVLSANLSSFSIANTNGDCAITFQVTATGAGVQPMPDPLEYASSLSGGQYVSVQNPAAFRKEIGLLINDITDGARTGSGAAPAVNTLGGNDLVLQSLYLPEYKTESPEQEVSWVGILNALFIDDQGDYREDTNRNKRLDLTDAVVRFVTNDTDGSLEFQRGTRGADNTVTMIAGTQDLHRLNTVWSANRELSVLTDDEVIQHDGYLKSDRRYIFTSIENEIALGGFDGISQADEAKVPFATVSQGGDANFDGRLKRLLDVDVLGPLASDDVTDFGSAVTGARAENLIDYIRGKDFDEYRSRDIQWATSDGQITWRLGDIVNSTPKIVGAPSESYGIVYGDTTYDEFVRKNRNRRQVAYVGANDGMLHAFNVGFFKDGQYFTGPDGTAGTVGLGSELWAYIPSSLLPHLKWLADPDYNGSHVFYVDSSVQTFDVRIFDNESSDLYHEGWGTILVVGMRLGGGDYDLGSKQTLSPSYMIFDITDPEREPSLLAEFSVDKLGHTFGQVEIAKFRDLNPDGTFGKSGGNTGRDDWFLVLGSGPRGSGAYENVVSDQVPSVHTLDLTKLTKAPYDIDIESVDTDDSATPGEQFNKNGFIGGIAVADWNFDFYDDALYFGIVGDQLFDPDDTSAPIVNRGALMQAELDVTKNEVVQAPSVLLKNGSGALNREFSVPPTARRDTAGNRWVFAGSGRYLGEADIQLTNFDNAFYGIKLHREDSKAFDSVDVTDMFDSNLVDVFFNAPPDGFDVESRQAFIRLAASRASSGDIGSADVSVTTDAGNTLVLGSVEDLQFYIATDTDVRGWFRDFTDTGELSAQSASLFGNSAAFNTFVPASGLSCQSEGESFQYVVDLASGLPQTQLLFPRVASSGTTADSKPVDRAAPRSNPMDGFASQPMVMNDTLVSTMSSGRAEASDITLILDNIERRSWREVPLEYINR